MGVLRRLQFISFRLLSLSMMLRRITLPSKPRSKFLTFSISPSPPYSCIHVVESSSTSPHKPTTDFSRSHAFSRNLSAISSSVFLLNSSRISTFTGNGRWFLSAQCLIQQGRSFCSQAHGTSRESMNYDVLVVGAGPAGLSAAIRLKQLCKENDVDLSVCVVEKGAEVGAHILSGNVFEPRALDELIHGWKQKEAPVHVPVSSDMFWYNNNKAEVTQLVRNESYKNTELLLPPPTADNTIDVPTVAATLLTAHTAWVVGQLQFTPTGKKYYLSNCGNCKKKVKAGADWFLRCSSCGEMRDVDFKCRVPLELKGEDKSLPIVLTSPDVENLTGITATQLRDSHAGVDPVYWRGGAWTLLNIPGEVTSIPL